LRVCRIIIASYHNYQWEQTISFLKTCPNIYIGQEKDCRNFLEAVFWITRSGAQWRLLPAHYDNWNSIYKRFARWSQTGVFEKLFEHFAQDSNLEYLLIDSTVVRSPSLQPPEQKKHGAQSLGRSRGGFSTKIHLATDALGNAIRFILTGGERNDITQAAALTENLIADYVLADKGYNSDAFVLKLKETGAEVVIPSRVNRQQPRTIDEHLYKERHLVECCIGKLKHFRRVFSRFDKLAKNYLSFVYFASTIVWLR
jgi:transposase